MEHVEVDESTVASNQSYKSLITSGLAFGAIRWVASLDRQCERLAISMTINIPPAADHFGIYIILLISLMLHSSSRYNFFL